MKFLAILAIFGLIAPLTISAQNAGSKSTAKPTDMTTPDEKAIMEKDYNDMKARYNATISKLEADKNNFTSIKDTIVAQKQVAINESRTEDVEILQGQFNNVTDEIKRVEDRLKPINKRMEFVTIHDDFMKDREKVINETERIKAIVDEEEKQNLQTKLKRLEKLLVNANDEMESKYHSAKTILIAETKIMVELSNKKTELKAEEEKAEEEKDKEKITTLKAAIPDLETQLETKKQEVKAAIDRIVYRSRIRLEIKRESLILEKKEIKSDDPDVEMKKLKNDHEKKVVNLELECHDKVDEKDVTIKNLQANITALEEENKKLENQTCKNNNGGNSDVTDKPDGSNDNNKDGKDGKGEKNEKGDEGDDNENDKKPDNKGAIISTLGVDSFSLMIINYFLLFRFIV